MRGCRASLGIRAAFAATGQTGILIAGGGVPIDRVVSDFVAGAAELHWSISSRQCADWVVVEGQGALLHPAYSGRDSRPSPWRAPRRARPVSPCRTPSDRRLRRSACRARRSSCDSTKQAASWVRPAPVAAIAINPHGASESDVREYVDLALLARPASRSLIHSIEPDLLVAAVARGLCSRSEEKVHEAQLATPRASRRVFRSSHRTGVTIGSRPCSSSSTTTASSAMGRLRRPRITGRPRATVEAALVTLAAALADHDDPAQVEVIHHIMETALAGHHSARAAIDVACHDWIGKRHGRAAMEDDRRPARRHSTIFVHGRDR